MLHLVVISITEYTLASQINVYNYIHTHAHILFLTSLPLHWFTHPLTQLPTHSLTHPFTASPPHTAEHHKFACHQNVIIRPPDQALSMCGEAASLVQHPWSQANSISHMTLISQPDPHKSRSEPELVETQCYDNLQGPLSSHCCSDKDTRPGTSRQGCQAPVISCIDFWLWLRDIVIRCLQRNACWAANYHGNEVTDDFTVLSILKFPEDSPYGQH